MFSFLREQQVQNAAFCEESVVFTCLTYKNVHRFRDGPIHELYGLKASQMSKVRASSHEYPHVEKNKNLREQNFKGEATTSNWRGPVGGGGGGGCPCPPSEFQLLAMSQFRNILVSPVGISLIILLAPFQSDNPHSLQRC